MTQVLPRKLHLADRWRTWPASPHNARLQVSDRRILAPDGRRTKVLICGAGKYKEEAPMLDDPTWEVWALNLCPPFDEEGRLRADVWFDLHQRKAQTADDMRWIADCPFPIYVPPDLEDASANAVRFPLPEIEAAYGAYWSCTFAYQIALVLWDRRATDLALFGVELAYGSQRERTVEWACVTYWLGRAEERGLQVHLPTRSTLGRHVARYGFEYDKEKELVQEYVDYLNEGDELRRQRKDEGIDVGG